MCRVRVERMDQCRSLQDDADSRMTMPMNSTLVAFRQAEPTLKIEIVLDLVEVAVIDE